VLSTISHSGSSLVAKSVTPVHSLLFASSTVLLTSSPFGSVLDTGYVNMVSTHHDVVSFRLPAALVEGDRDNALFSKGDVYGSSGLVGLVSLTLHVRLCFTEISCSASAWASTLYHGDSNPILSGARSSYADGTRRPACSVRHRDRSPDLDSYTGWLSGRLLACNRSVDSGSCGTTRSSSACCCFVSFGSVCMLDKPRSRRRRRRALQGLLLASVFL